MREDFLATYAIGRIVPSGTMTAMAVAYGYRFGGWLGSNTYVSRVDDNSAVLGRIRRDCKPWPPVI